MEPTVLHGEYILARFYVGRATPKRGDLVIFRNPMGGDVEYFKRVIALPGDRVQLRGGFVYLDGIKLPREPLNGNAPALERHSSRAIQYIETLPDGRRYQIEKMSNNGPLNDTREIVVPPDHYFVLGDNRDNSLDSRDPAMGLIPEQDLVARAYLMIWSDSVQRIGTVFN